MWATHLKAKGSADTQLMDLASLMKHSRRVQQNWYDLTVKSHKAKRACVVINLELRLVCQQILELSRIFPNYRLFILMQYAKSAVPTLETPKRRKKKDLQVEVQDQEKTSVRLC